MVQVHIEGTAQEVRAQMQALLHGAESTVQPSAPTPKEKKKVELEPQATKTAETAPASKVTLQDIKEIIPKVMDKLGKPGIVTMLLGPGGKFGAKKGSELKEEHYEEFMTLAREAIK